MPKAAMAGWGSCLRRSCRWCCRSLPRWGGRHGSSFEELGLVEAADNKIGNVVDQAFLYCFRYDPEAGTYSAAVLNILRLAATLTIVLLVVLLWVLRRRDHKAPEPKTPLTAGTT